MDILRLTGWPDEFSGRVLRNDVTAQWHGREDELRAKAQSLYPAYQEAAQRGDLRQVVIHAGEVVGLMHEERSVADILASVARQAESLLEGRGRRPAGP